MDLTVIFIVFTIFIKLTYKMIDTYLIFSDQEEKNKYGKWIPVNKCHNIESLSQVVPLDLFALVGLIANASWLGGYSCIYAGAVILNASNQIRCELEKSNIFQVLIYGMINIIPAILMLSYYGGKALNMDENQWFVPSIIATLLIIVQLIIPLLISSEKEEHNVGI
tara:strand:+ start:180 stop:677 length:498 start_codon:yes stop_codon:yes gene_type:complete